MDSLYKLIEALKEPKDDEVVYPDEEKPINLSFDEIKVGTLKVVRSF